MQRLLVLLLPLLVLGTRFRGPSAKNLTKTRNTGRSSGVQNTTKMNVTGISAEESRKISEACESACARDCHREKVSVTETPLPDGGKKTVTQWREICEMQSHCVTGCETDMYQCIDKVPEVNFNHTTDQISPCQSKVLAKYKKF
eukprot:gnl/MRDRNA2_/MRDRNA2_74053_c0_seq2.p1 gnl/MRDRNA2_/MRDRNA2_74053_c0~~gnl/MRDRNA2_/MRDRNA2_74053_c0_seq2.p1  ORF type:complete len:144 (+),score=15.81 gnl/MRDRNA2_/MRDRNA2_74053_c0_seq2:149-580(+)